MQCFNGTPSNTAWGVKETVSKTGLKLEINNERHYSNICMRVSLTMDVFIVLIMLPISHFFFLFLDESGRQRGINHGVGSDRRRTLSSRCGKFHKVDS